MVLATAPIAAVPSSELSSINNGALAIFKHALISIRTTRVDAEYLHLIGSRVHTESAVVHLHQAIRAGELSQSLRNVHVIAPRSILRAQDQELSFIANVRATSAVPVAAPSALTPVATPPAAKLGPIKHAVVGKLKHAFAPVWT